MNNTYLEFNLDEILTNLGGNLQMFELFQLVLTKHFKFHKSRIDKFISTIIYTRLEEHHKNTTFVYYFMQTNNRFSFTTKLS